MELSPTCLREWCGYTWVSLDALVDHVGAFDRITPAMWQAFDQFNARAYAAMLTGTKYYDRPRRRYQ
jgi:hypothetical protein